MSGMSLKKEARDAKKKEKRQLKRQKRDARKQGTADKDIPQPGAAEIDLPLSKREGAMADENLRARQALCRPGITA